MRLISLIFLTFLLLHSCLNEVNPDTNSEMKDKADSLMVRKDSAVHLPKDTLVYLLRNKYSITLRIQAPDNIRGAVLLLHGWNLPSQELCEKTALCKMSLDSGYILIIPDFGKTTYQIHNFPETKKNYLKYPTRQWIQDTFITYLQNELGLLLPGRRNFVYGVSTGGRGAALLALENPSVFKAAACLSADFDHSKLQNEPINNGYYGSIKLFPERWNGIDNIYNRAGEFKNGLYLAHGEKDKICPVSQTIEFADQVKKVNKAIVVESEIDPSGDHTYQYWDKKTISVLGFFSKF